MHDDLFQLLTEELGIASLFPGGIHHMSLPQGVDVYPAMAFQQVSMVEFAEDMESPDQPKVDQANYQFSITAKDSHTVISTSDAFIAIFRNFRGTMGATIVQSVQLGNVIQLEDRRGDKLRRQVVTDFLIFFNA